MLAERGDDSLFQIAEFQLFSLSFYQMMFLLEIILLNILQNRTIFQGLTLFFKRQYRALL